VSAALSALLQSPLGRGVSALHNQWIEWNERRFNIQTGQNSIDLVDRRQLASSKYDDGLHYHAPDYANLFKIVRILKPTREDVFYEIGCGKGRVLCVMARQELNRVVGVELVKDLCAQARDNAAQMRGRKSAIDVVCGDACKLDLSGGTIYFFYNPFGPNTFMEVLSNIRHGLGTEKKIKIVYYNAENEHVFRDAGWLERYAHFSTKTGRVVAFWRCKAV
jgi:SAM-dependent methyltransferase